jgi:integrase
MSPQFEYRGYTIRPHGRRWRVQLRIEGRNRSVVRDTPEELKRALDAVLEDVQAYRSAARASADVATVGAGHMTISDLVEAWFAWKTGPDTDEPIRGRTRRDYRRAIDRHIVPEVGSRDAALVTGKEIKNDLLRPASSRTGARFARTVLNQAFRWAIEEELIARVDNPCEGIGVLKREHGDGRARKGDYIPAVADEDIPSIEEIEKMLEWCIETGRRSWWLWVYLTAKLGLRPSETCALQREDFDLKRGLVHIRRSTPSRFDTGDWHLKTPTSRRTLPIGKRFVSQIGPFLPESGWLFPARARGGGLPQRTHTATPCWPNDAPNREFRRMRRELGLSEAYHPYSLRHFAATTVILRGKTEIQVAKYLGTSVEMLQKTYANHLKRDAQRDIGDTLSELF